MSLDAFFKNLEKVLNEETQAAAEKGLAQAALLWLRDSIMVVNRVPLDEGTLRGSASVFVGAALKHTSSDAVYPSQPGGEPGTVYPFSPPDRRKQLTALVGFNTPYAAYQHEGVRADGSHVVRNYSHSGTGKDFLMGKGRTNAKHYYAHIRDVIVEDALRKIIPTKGDTE